jgi:hypothetical protein
LAVTAAQAHPVHSLGDPGSFVDLVAWPGSIERGDALEDHSVVRHVTVAHGSGEADQPALARVARRVLELSRDHHQEWC